MKDKVFRPFLYFVIPIIPPIKVHFMSEKSKYSHYLKKMSEFLYLLAYFICFCHKGSRNK